MNDSNPLRKRFLMDKYRFVNNYSELQRDEGNSLNNGAMKKCECCLCSKKAICVLAFVIVFIILFIAIQYIHKKASCVYGSLGSEDIGKPNFYLTCGAEKEDCKLYGYEYYSSKEEKECCPGKLVHLCVYPDIIKKLPSPTPSNYFKVMSWNVFIRPFYISQEGQRERSCFIPRWISSHLSHVDVMCFQELFLDGCWGERSSIRLMLKAHGFPYSTKFVTSSMHLNNAGVVIVSRWPIVYQDSFVFSYVNYHSIGKYITPKGILYARILKSVNSVEMIYNIFATHLHANQGSMNAKVRKQNLQELNSFIASKNISTNEPVLIGGDFNMDVSDQRSELNELLTVLDAKIPVNISKLNYTSDNVENLLNQDTTSVSIQEWLDYVVYKKDHREPKNATFDCIAAHSSQRIATCICARCVSLGIYYIPNSKNCDKLKYYTDLSDHYPVIASFEF